MSQKKISFTLKELSKTIDASITGDENIIISNIATIQEANTDSISFISNKKYLSVCRKLFFIHYFDVVKIHFALRLGGVSNHSKEELVTIGIVVSN